MVMAYLMEKNGMSFDDALKLVQKKRKYAKYIPVHVFGSNSGFIGLIPENHQTLN